MPGYQVKIETIRVEGQEFHIRSLLDAQQYHDPLGEAERLGISPESWPLFGQVWPSGQVLACAMYVMELRGRRVLELGAGLALASLVVHQRGGDMTVSDYHPMIPQFLEHNLRLNGLGPIKYRAADWALHDVDLGEFDLIIGSDLLYEHGQPQVLADFIDRHSADSVEVLIVDPDRRNRSRFRREMAELEYVGEMRRADRLLGSGEAFKGSFLHFHREAA
jgi:predicted nicotinamide N-methyase